ncbi:MAG: trypsin-like peptidase domain-containing protein [Pirellulaceae bacterium]|nr:trypsin-like peptidase domain-containing protein [Pirellulaceae bacterium]
MGVVRPLCLTLICFGLMQIMDMRSQQAMAQTNATAVSDTAQPPSTLVDAADKDLKNGRTTSPEEAQHNRASARELSRAFRDAAARAVPSVVTIKVRTKESAAGGVLDVIGSGDAGFDGFGSGVIVTEEGLILTNNHVVKDGKHIEVMLLDGRQFTAHDVKADSPSDLAILRIDVNEKLPAATFGNSTELNVGDWVLAIGSPFNLHSTVSAGIISSKNRPMDLIKGSVLQTDAAVNPGNSGGPLIDLDGNVVGINTAISSSSGTFQGVGFAIPVNRAIWVKNELAERGKVRRGRMGAQVGSIPLDVSRQLDLPGTGGAYVVSTVPDRSADKAGLMPGDIVISFDNQRVADEAELADMILASPIDEAIDMTIIRSGERMTLKITLEAAK